MTILASFDISGRNIQNPVISFITTKTAVYLRLLDSTISKSVSIDWNGFLRCGLCGADYGILLEL